MKRWSYLPLLPVLIILAWGCAAMTVHTDFDPAADFTAFRTYSFAGMTDLNQGGVLDNSLVRKRLEQMIEEQLTAKGLRQVAADDKADLHVHYWVGLKDKQRIENSGPSVGMYGGRGGYGYGVGYSGVSSYEYTEGTLIVDLVTPANKELVWRGTMVGTLEDSKESNMQMASKAIAQAFAEYPPKRADH